MSRGDLPAEPMSTADLEQFEAQRPRLEAIAYRMLGSASDAEDMVQEAFLRWQGADRGQIEVPAAWLTRVLTNLCRTRLTSAAARRETYVGQWLPEPVLDGDAMLGPAETAEQRDSVSTAVLVLMERLTPDERAVYVLREAFAVPHSEIAEMLEITEAASQQLLHRARERVSGERTRRAVDRSTARAVVAQFLDAASGGQIDQLVRLLTTDVVGIGDGGGHVPARPTAMSGAQQVARFIRGLAKPTDAKRALVGGSPALYAWVANGSPAMVIEMDGQVVGVMTLDLTDEGIAAVLNQVNPDKLGRANRLWRSLDPGEPLIAAW